MTYLKRKLLLTLTTFICVIAAAFYWLFFDNRMPTEGSFPLDISEIRAEAAKISGARATSIHVEILSHTPSPKIALVAGTEWTKIDLVRTSYQVTFPKQSIIIDTGYDAVSAKKAHAISFDSAAWERMQTGMQQATAIVVTHEHGDHIGGLLTSPHWSQLLPKALINQKQFDGEKRTSPVVWPDGSRTHFMPIQYDRMLAIAPGVVIIRAAGHTPGSQMIYVQLANGQEYLFMGDVASMADNVRLLKIRSRFATDIIGNDDRRAVMLEVKALNNLAVANPNIALVPGHDAEAIHDLERKGLLVTGFNL